MTVESVTYINDLDKTYPAIGEVGTLHEGDDHIRNIKKALTNSFPNFSGIPVTASEQELNRLDGMTASAAELNVLDGITASTAELNILDGVTASAAELNKLAGTTVTGAELNYVSGVTSSIQNQLNAIKIFDIQFTLPVGSNGTFVLLQKASFSFSILNCIGDTQSGSIKCAVQIEGNNVTNCGDLLVDGSETDTSTGSSGTYEVAIGNTLQLVLSENDGATMVSIQLKCSRI